MDSRDIRTYSELIKYDGFLDRFRYLKLHGTVASETFGSHRYINQKFYTSADWRSVRSYVITRDMGWDLGVYDKVITGKIFVHHMNPLIVQDIIHSTDNLLNPEFLITCSLDTHNAIHYGDESLVTRDIFIEREPGDTYLW